MPEPTTLAELKENLTRIEGRRSLCPDPATRAMYDVEIMDLREKITELERPDAAAFSNGAPCGGI